MRRITLISLFCCLIPFLAGLPFSAPLVEFVKFYLFCVPAGWLTALFSGGEFSFAANEAVVLTERLRILIPPSCAGFPFYWILCASAILVHRNRIVLIFAAAYPATLLINTLRILCVSNWEILFSRRIPLPPGFQHQAVGILIFLPALIASVFVLELYCRKGKYPDGTPE